MNLQQQERFYQMMTRLKANSRAASTTEDVRITEMVNGTLVSKPAKRIEYISEPSEPQAQVWNLTKNGPVLESKAGSTEYEVVKKYIDMGGSSTGDQVYKCGLHDFETKNLTEFNRHVENHSSKAASVSGTNKIKEIHDFINGKR